jgi:hypothetical protein
MKAFSNNDITFRVNNNDFLGQKKKPRKMRSRTSHYYYIETNLSFLPRLA